jgi:hypothetical protein
MCLHETLQMAEEHKKSYVQKNKLTNSVAFSLEANYTD